MAKDLSTLQHSVAPVACFLFFCVCACTPLRWNPFVQNTSYTVGFKDFLFLKVLVCSESLEADRTGYTWSLFTLKIKPFLLYHWVSVYMTFNAMRNHVK